MNRISFLLTIYLLWLCCQLPIHAARATTSCAYSFSSGSGNTFLNYCVTVNGNIPLIKTPSGVQLMGPDGEGYGVCNESPAQNYTDYGVSDTGNWRPAILLSHNTSGSVQIARTTSDGQWTLTQTIALTHTPSITVIMALKNNQSVQKVAYLVRFADPLPPGVADYTYVGGLNGALTWDAPQYGYSCKMWVRRHLDSGKGTCRLLQPGQTLVPSPLTKRTLTRSWASHLDRSRWPMSDLCR